MAADAAEARAAEALQRGLGVEGVTALLEANRESERQEAAGVSSYFGAASAQKLRERLRSQRPEASVPTTGTLEHSVASASSGSLEASKTQHVSQHAAAEQQKSSTHEPNTSLPYTSTLAVRSQVTCAHLSPDAAQQCHVRSLEAGGGGDCLFHSIAAALEQMLQSNPAAAQHVIRRISRETFLAGKASVVSKLRDLSAIQLTENWSPEALLDFLLAAVQRQAYGAFPDEWSPRALLHACGFDFQTAEGFHFRNCESVQAFQIEPSGDAVMRLAFTDNREGGGARDEVLHLLPAASVKLADLRAALGAQFRRLGNWHWGDQTDARNLCEALDLGLLIFRESQLENPRQCLYNIGAEREDFPYWISMWWVEPYHFQLAEVAFGDRADRRWRCFWDQTALPQTLWQGYRTCNRLAN